jgi:hypothetical protein
MPTKEQECQQRHIAMREENVCLNPQKQNKTKETKVFCFKSTSVFKNKQTNFLLDLEFRTLASRPFPLFLVTALQVRQLTRGT